MSATIDERLEALQLALDAAIARGVNQVSVGGDSVSYMTVDEIRAALAELRAQKAATQTGGSRSLASFRRPR